MGSPVLLTVPVLIYAVFAKEPNGSFPLSHECNTLLERCRTKYHRGIITTTTIERCWTIMQKISKRVQDLDADNEEGTQTPDPVERRRPRIQKRIAALLRGDLRIVTVEVGDFEASAGLVRDFRIPAAIAVEVAAGVRECNLTSLPVALPGKPKWAVHESIKPCWCSDLPWQIRQRALSQIKPNQDQGRLKL